MTAEEVLRRLVSINSIFPNEEQLALFLEKYVRGMGFKTRRDYLTKKRFNILAERGHGNTSILFYGHMDTVPLYGKWQHDPFRLSRSGDKLIGLGSCDMKGGIAAMLASIGNSERKIKILFCVDEENISAGAWHVVGHERGWFSDVSMVVSLEAGTSKKHVGGSNVITLGRRGRTVIELNVEGLSAHAASMERGVSAVDEAAKIIGRIESIPLEKNRYLGDENVFVRKIESASTSLSVPEKLHMEIDAQLVPPTTSKKMEERVKKFVSRLQSSGILDKRTRIRINVKKRETPYIEPYVIDTGNRRVRKATSIIRKMFGRAETNYSKSVGDDNILANSLRVPVLTIGPAGGSEHAHDEWVSRKSLEEVGELYRMIVEKM